MDVRTLISDEDEFARSFLAIPQKQDMYTPTYEVPLIAVALVSGMWIRGEVSNTHWRFFKYGVECEWDDLTGDQRYAVRTRVAWDGQVKDYWTGLKYQDERYCVLEVLSA